MVIALVPEAQQGLRPTSSDSIDNPKEADLGRRSNCGKAQNECHPLALSREYRHIALNASKELNRHVVAEDALHDALALGAVNRDAGVYGDSRQFGCGQQAVPPVRCDRVGCHDDHFGVHPDRLHAR
ncbi:hypothetical protein HPB50_024662 [Hyalomma asiaticum]|uniref:Uncharacterized protein n=1 Tax=Hyalomma asiaticum TaxID=266040 RepID=A0ACB7RP88_HYAAI|nr:hypothetical protein HPB50_024662 [Hyalomma asiaticum]